MLRCWEVDIPTSQRPNIPTMYCPNCRSEYRQGFTHCSDCDVDLVPALPPDEVRRDDVHLVKVFETGDASLIGAREREAD